MIECKNIVLNRLTVSSPLTDENPYKKARLDEEIESEMDLSAVLGPQVTKIGTATPVKDFLQLLCKGTESVAAICTQMEEVIRQVIIDSAGSNAALMTKSFDCLKIYRQEALNRGLIDAFNAFAVALKAGNFHIFWEQYVTDKVGLITNQESPLSKVTQADAVDFLRLDSSLCDQPLIESDDENLVTSPLNKKKTRYFSIFKILHLLLSLSLSIIYWPIF